METKKRQRLSKVDAALKGLKVDQKIKIIGSISYWRNRQAVFHGQHPEIWIEISTENKRGFAQRIK